MQRSTWRNTIHAKQCARRVCQKGLSNLYVRQKHLRQHVVIHIYTCTHIHVIQSQTRKCLSGWVVKQPSEKRFAIHVILTKTVGRIAVSDGVIREQKQFSNITCLFFCPIWCERHGPQRGKAHARASAQECTQLELRV